MIRVEVCAGSIESAITAQQEGACRVELCANLAEGGTTPSYGQIVEVRKRLGIELYPIIRPRGGGFFYTGPEYDVMRRDVEFCGEARCDGVVIGMLDAGGGVDTPRCRELIGLARGYGMGVTFHRAFDAAADLERALEDIIALGCERLLTSGGARTAVEGIVRIGSLTRQAAGRIIVMPGSGVAPENIERIVTETGCREIHGTFRGNGHSQMTAPITERPRHDVWRTDPDKVRKAVEIARKL